MIDASVNRTETVLRKISSRDGLQQVVMMQAAETRAGSDAMSGGYAMYGQCRLVRRVIWKSRAQRGMWSFTVVQVDNATPIVLSLDKFVIRGIHGPVA